MPGSTEHLPLTKLAPKCRISPEADAQDELCPDQVTRRTIGR